MPPSHPPSFPPLPPRGRHPDPQAPSRNPGRLEGAAAAGGEEPPRSLENQAPVLELVHRGHKIRLDVCLCQSLPGRSRSFIQKLIDEGWVKIPELPVNRDLKASTLVTEGMKIQVFFPPVKKSTLAPEDIPIRILYEDSDLAVVDKPAGLVMHPSAHKLQGTLVNSLLYHLKDLSGIGGEERPGIVHRLDRDTSGVLLIAKNDLAHQSLSTQFKERIIQKTYLAVLRGEWTAKEGMIHLPIGRCYYNRKRMMVRTDGNAREALTTYTILETFDGYALAEIRPHTGRTHQIRVHMAKIRMPVACDRLYGREKAIGLSDLQKRPPQPGEAPLIQRQALHAHRIEINHPSSGQRLEFTADLPADMASLLEALRKYRS
ncbi:MAG: RluA family pseudouridine synthase [Planctomycetes bacterium]|nr:RluA family pseudouridine synthase [Planctomycetota bacterium]